MSSPHYKGSKLPIADFEKQIISVEEGRVIIKPRALDITWGGDDRYWRFTNDTAELVQVSWLEVTGSLETKYLRKDTIYKLEFRVRLKPDAFGWNDSPVYMMVKLGNGNRTWKKEDLSKIKESSTIPYTSCLKFTMPASGNDKLNFGLYEIWKGRWKGGLLIEGVVITPVPSNTDVSS